MTKAVCSLLLLIGRLANRSGTADISDALRNLCLGHANSVPFQRHYLAREICADTFAIVLGEAPQQALITQSCSIAHSISKRRPIRLTPEQVASIDTDPRITDMKRKLRNMPLRSKKRTTASRNLRKAKQRMKNALRMKIREEWKVKSTRRLEEPVVESPLYAVVLSVFVSNEKERTRRCFLCVGKALSSSPDDSTVPILINEFYTSSDLIKHFRRKHLSNLQSGDNIYCRVCDIPLDHKMHLQSHAHRVHGIPSVEIPH